MVDIYLITNKLNGMQYVGKSKNYKKRFLTHCRNYKYGVHTPISLAIHEYGKNNFSVKLLAKVDDSDGDWFEEYYINQYKTHYTQGGYNISWGGKNNPMDTEYGKQKQKVACNTKEARLRYSEQAKQYNASEKRKEVQKRFNETYLSDPQFVFKITRGLRAYTDSQKIKIGMCDDDGKVLKEFDSLSDACRFVFNGQPYNKGNTSAILRYADKINKNGKQAKYLGYVWTKL